MFLPAQYFWLEPVILAAIVVFIVDLLANMLSFSNRYVNALLTALLFTAIFGPLVYFGYGKIQISVQTSPSSTAPAKK